VGKQEDLPVLLVEDNPDHEERTATW